MKIKKSSNISATALHCFIPQPASGRSSALPCLAANIVLSKLLWEIHLHGLKFIPDDFLERFNTFSIYEILPQLIELWGLNTAVQVESKKNIARLTDR